MSTPIREDAEPPDTVLSSRWMGRSCAAGFVGLIAIQEICGPSLEAIGGWKFSDWLLLAFLAGGAFWLLVSSGAHTLGARHRG